jgi:hypothetical protein
MPARLSLTLFACDGVILFGPLLRDCSLGGGAMTVGAGVFDVRIFLAPISLQIDGCELAASDDHEHSFLVWSPVDFLYAYTESIHNRLQCDFALSTARCCKYAVQYIMIRLEV